MTLKYLIQKEFLQIRRNSFMPRIIFIFPIMVMCVMPWVMNQEVKNVRVDVVDNDRSTLSQQLVHSIEASNYFVFNGLRPTYNAAFKDVVNSLRDAGAGFGVDTNKVTIIARDGKKKESPLMSKQEVARLIVQEII